MKGATPTSTSDAAGSCRVTEVRARRRGPVDTARLKEVAKERLPGGARTFLRRRGLTAYPPIGWVRLAGLRRVTPISEHFGQERGRPVDRFYIEDFLGRHGGVGGDITGRVMEVGEDLYTRTYGHEVTATDVLHVDNTNPAATIVADIGVGDGIPSEAFDCVICTQTLQFVYDLRAGIDNLRSALRPGGVLLVTVPGLTRLTPESAQWPEYWHLTSHLAARMFGESFGTQNVSVEAYGNVLSSVAFLHGLAAQELDASELTYRDQHFEVTVAVRAVRA